MKEVLIKSAKKKLEKQFNKDMSDINQDITNYEFGMYDALKKLNNPETAFRKTNIETVKETLSIISKTNYHFPELLRVGELLNLRKTPSKILNQNGYLTTTPFLIPIRDFGMGFFMNAKYKEKINAIIELSALKLITSVPNGLVKLTLIDKTGSGQNLKRLSSLHEKFLDGKILSEDNEIELELESIKNSMGVITQSISSNGFESIEDYNVNTDEAPQQYKVICVANFPNGFNKKASENLLSLMESGPKAGIYVFLTINLNSGFGMNQNINGLTLADFVKHTTLFEISDRPNDYITNKLTKETIELFKIPLIAEKDYKHLVNNIFAIKMDEENKEEVEQIIKYLNDSIEHISLRPLINLKKAYPKDLWTKKAGKGICVPFGKRGIENVFISLGINQYGEDEDTHHGMIGGSTGSGKTVLIHDIILQTALNYSPKEVQFFLLDYKEGTEFAIYKDFPYVSILSMESEIEFGHDVLDKAIKMISERGALFKEMGSSNLNNYNSKVEEDKKLPRIIIIIDEFQVLFPNNQKISAKTNERLNDILRRGRSFGINLLLATQTLKGLDLDPAILSNMPLRIALKMDEKDSIKLFGEGNPAPKFISVPGEGIYNKSFGNSKQNVNFQAFLAINETVPETINMINNHMENTLSSSDINKLFDERFVYNGEQIPYLKNNTTLTNKINKKESSNYIYLGEPAGLEKEDLKIKFDAEYGDNLLVIGSEQDKVASLFYSMLYQIALLNKESKIYSFNFNTILEEKINNKLSNIEHNINFVNNKNSEEKLDEIYNILLERKKTENISENIFFFNFFTESGKIFNPEGFSDKNINKIKTIIKEGPEFGIHTIIYASDFNSLTSNELSRELSKFKKKIAFTGGSSLKIFGLDSGLEFSKSGKNLVAIIHTGEPGVEAKKFKPYEVFKEEDSL